jgi:hypothetical protein
VSSTSVAYLKVRYSIPQELVGNIAGVDALIEQTLGKHFALTGRIAAGTSRLLTKQSSKGSSGEGHSYELPRT